MSEQPKTGPSTTNAAAAKTAEAKKTRHVRTPAEKAQDLLNQANARHQRAKITLAKANKALSDAQAVKDAAGTELKAAEKAVDFLSGNPDLPSSGTAS